MTGRYETGTSLEDKSGEFSAEVSRSKNKDYFLAKWGTDTPMTDYLWLSNADNLKKLKSTCGNNFSKRFCTPFNSKQGVIAWNFSPEYRECVRDGIKGDCLKFVPLSLNGIR